MASPKVLTGHGDGSVAEAKGQPTRPVGVLGWAGLTFLIVGGADLLLTFLPLQLGNREWEFGSYTSAMNGLPVPVLGLALMVWSAVTGRRRGLAGLAVVVSVVLLAGIVVGAVLWATGIPLALQSVPQQVADGLKKALIKSTVQSVAYPLLLVYMTRQAWHTLRARS